MKPDIVVDVGNSRIKWGWAVPGGIRDTVSLSHDDPVGWKRQLSSWGIQGFVRWAVAGVNPKQVARLREWLDSRQSEVLEITTPGLLEIENRLGIEVAVDEPAQVGVDRILNALAAARREPRTSPTAVISVGTAMTVDFIDRAGRFVGGAILPGPSLMARSLHEHTAKLPHVAITPEPRRHVFGSNTEDAISVGIASAVIGAADQLVWDWSKKWDIPTKVILTGGDCGYFAGFFFTADTSRVVFDRALTLDGIRIAAEALP